jgi:hypothetical protein
MAISAVTKVEPGVLRVSALSIKRPQLISLIPELVRPEGLMPEDMQ